jgi:ribosomal protein L40E
MKDIVRVIAEKEFALRQVNIELEALRITLELLREPGDADPLSVAAVTATAALDANMPISAAAPPHPAPAVPPGMTARPGVLSFNRPASSASVITATANAVAATGAPIRKTVFADQYDGVLVCDSCGHRNPQYVMDCEKCDIPLRLRN